MATSSQLFNSPVDLQLTLVPSQFIQDPIVIEELQRVYNAIRRIQTSLTYQTVSSVIASGTTLGTATVIDSDIAIISSGTGGVLLNQVGGGSTQFIRNATGVAINLYPNGGGRINSLGIGVPFSLAAGAATFLVMDSDNHWVTH